MRTTPFAAIRASHAPAAHRRTLTVGYDGSGGSIAAVEWAADQVLADNARVRVLTCLRVPRRITGAHSSPDFLPVYEAAGRALHGEPGAQSDAGSVDFTHEVVFGATLDRLVVGSLYSELLVIGTAGQLLLGAWRLGSNTHELLRHASCPVVLVPRGHAPANHRRIIAAVDGTTSHAALRWAAGEANRVDAELIIVHAWGPGSRNALTGRCSDDWAKWKAAVVITKAAQVAAQICRSPISTRLVDGAPSPCLLAQAFNADMLVIGSRAAGSRSTELGSVARAIAACATSPTVVVRDDAKTGSPSVEPRC